MKQDGCAVPAYITKYREFWKTMKQSSEKRFWLEERRDAVLADWIHDLRVVWGDLGLNGTPKGIALESAAATVLDDVLTLLVAAQADADAQSRLHLDADDPRCERLRELIVTQAQRGVSAAASAETLNSLRRILRRQQEAVFNADPEQVVNTAVWEAVLDQLVAIGFAAYLESREQTITEQSLSLLELSTPVLRVWNRILLLPLVGVVDTARAQHFTERLLESVARYEARVTIIDVTGVPVLDTSVAQHLMRTIDAARLLGTRIVMTGISPEGAQTLTKLGIRFSDVVSRATLRSGIAEALHLLNQRIVTVTPDGKT